MAGSVTGTGGASGGVSYDVPLPPKRPEEFKRIEDYKDKNNGSTSGKRDDVHETDKDKDRDSRVQANAKGRKVRSDKQKNKVFVNIPPGAKNKKEYLEAAAKDASNKTNAPAEAKEAPRDTQPSSGGGGGGGGGQPPNYTLPPSWIGTQPPPIPPTGTNPSPPPQNTAPGGPLQGVGTPRVTGTLTINGKGYRFGSGSSSSHPHIPFGTYPITPNTIGPWGRANGAIGINNNSIWDPNLGRTRAGIEIHSSRSGFTEGCIGVDASQYEDLKNEINKMIQQNGSAYITIGPNGAYITPTPSGSPGASVTPSTSIPASSVVGASPGSTTLKMADGTVQVRTGDRNWRNNNPGNIEYGPFAKANGAIGGDGRFAVFPTLQAGQNAMKSLLFNSSSYAGKTIAEALTKYAPPSENNTQNYIQTVTSALGLPANTPMSSLTPAQQQKMIETMTKVEGFRPGSINGIPAGTAGGFTSPFTGTGGVTGGGTGGRVASQTGSGLYPSSTQGLNIGNNAFGNNSPQAVILSLAQFLQQNIAGYQGVLSFTNPPVGTPNIDGYKKGLVLDFKLVNPTISDSILVTTFIKEWFKDFRITDVIVTNYYLTSFYIAQGYIHIEIPSGIPAQQTLYVLDLLTAFNAAVQGITLIPL